VCEIVLNIEVILYDCKCILLILTFHNMQKKQCGKNIKDWLIKNTKNQDTYNFLSRNISLPNFAMTLISLTCFLLEIYISFCVWWPAVLCSFLCFPPPTHTHKARKFSHTKLFHSRFLPSLHYQQRSHRFVLRTFLV
jgi:hypothetical protein